MSFIQLLIPFILLSNSLLIDFTSDDKTSWMIVNDGVMGGLSKGRGVETDNGVLFFGTVSLENNGGFSSFRGPYQRYDLSSFKEVSIRYRSNGIRLALQLNVDQRFYYPNFKTNLPSSEEWTTITVKLADFKQYRLGYPTGGSFKEEDKTKVIRFGFITDEKRAGDFQFEVSSIEFK